MSSVAPRTDLFQTELTKSFTSHDLLAQINSYPPISQLYDVADTCARKSTGMGLEILLVSPEQIQRNGESRYNSTLGRFQILIKRTLSHEQFKLVYIKELANIPHLEKVINIYDQAKKHQLSQDDFVGKLEHAEYLGNRTYNITIAQLKRFYPETFSKFPDGFASFEAYKDYQERSGHSKIYRSIFPLVVRD
jgi:hypothetical protein